MASVLRITGVGLGGVGLSAVVWLVYFLRPGTGPGREAWAHWFDYLADFGYGLLVPGIAASAGGVLWSAGRLARPRPGGRWVGRPLRLLTATVAAVGAAALVASGYVRWWRWQTDARHAPAVGDQLRWLFGHVDAPNTTVAWIALGAAGLLAAAVHAAYPPPTFRRSVMPAVLRLLAVLLVAAGVVGYLANLVLCAAALWDGQPDRPGGGVGWYIAAIFNTLLPLVVVGLGGILWVAVRLAYPQRPAGHTTPAG